MPPFPRSGSGRRPCIVASEPDALVTWALNTTSNDDSFDAERTQEMRTTLTLDDKLLADAEFYTGIREKSALIREALKALVEREAARRLARLGGSEPGLKKIPRRRPKPA